MRGSHKLFWLIKITVLMTVAAGAEQSASGGDRSRFAGAGKPRKKGVLTMLLADIIALLGLCVLAAGLMLRGSTWHNHQVLDAAMQLWAIGCSVDLEYALPLPHGRTDVVDICANYGSEKFIVEVESTTRHAADNACKAAALGLPLWIVVPTRKLQKTIQRKLQSASCCRADNAINVVLLSQLQQEVRNYFCLFSPANDHDGKEKTNPKEGQNSDDGSLA